MSFIGRNGLMAVAAVALIGGAWAFWSNANNQGAAGRAYEAAGPAQDGPVIPELSRDAARGRIAFNQACAGCHGRDAAGGEGGPPLIHKIYEPNHHGDAAFHLAVKNGVRAHHWKFGDMPPQTGLTTADVDLIVAFVRETQRANGIF